MLGYIFEIMGNTSMVCDYIEQSFFNYDECKIDVIVIFLLSPLIDFNTFVSFILRNLPFSDKYSASSLSCNTLSIKPAQAYHIE